VTRKGLFTILLDERVERECMPERIFLPVLLHAKERKREKLPSQLRRGKVRKILPSAKSSTLTTFIPHR